MTKVSIVVVDDHQLFREAVIAKLEQEPELQVVAECDNAADTLVAVRQRSPDLVLMDISLEGMDGLETVRLINTFELSLRIIVLSMHSDHQYVGAALAQDVWGYVRKQEAFDDLVVAIRTVMAGERYFSPSLNVAASRGRPEPDEPSLTGRERDIVILVAKGLSSNEIAALHSISVKTVETHRANVYRKLGLRNSADLTRYAIRRGLISP